MRFIIKVFFTACAVMLAAWLMHPHIYVDGFYTGILVAFTLAILNAFVRPLMIIISIPATILTLGLFIFVINALMVLLAAKIFDENKFRVEGFWWALLFSLVVTFVSSILNGFINKDEGEQRQLGR